jgi:CxxC motif-containing protein (DUF1111 family)
MKTHCRLRILSAVASRALDALLAAFFVLATAGAADAPSAPKPPPPRPGEAKPEERIQNPKNNGFVKDQQFEEDLKAFEDVESVEGEPVPSNGVENNGLGPVYNNTSCVGCHQTPVTGAASQIVELRSGFSEWRNPTHKIGLKLFKEHKGGSVVHQRAIKPEFQQHVSENPEVEKEDNTRTFRLSTNILGDGFVEAISDDEIAEQVADPIKLAALKQICPGFDGRAVWVPAPVPPAPTKPKFNNGHSELHVGRFGWKNQQASLLGFSADAYVQEMGITSPLQPDDNTSDGKVVDDGQADPEDAPDAENPFGEDVLAFSRFMRALDVPPTGPTPKYDPKGRPGNKVFISIGCNACHRPQWTTRNVPELEQANIFKTFKDKKDERFDITKLANKTINPYSDFLLHNIGAGDGIVQFAHANKPSTDRANLDDSPLRKFEQKMIERRGKSTPEAAVAPGEDPVKMMIIYDSPGIQEAARSRTNDPAPATAPAAETNLDGAKKDEPELDKKNHRFIFHKQSSFESANRIRTAPLWGLRSRLHLMHDGQSLTILDAIERHDVEAAVVRQRFKELSEAEQANLLLFLNTL